MTKAFIQTTRCTISTLTPVHIGCGEDYYPTNYVIDSGLLHHFSEEGLLAALTLAERKQLAKLADERGDQGLKKLQAFIHGKKDSLQHYATHTVPVSAELERFYQSRVGQTVQLKGNGGKDNNKLEIARHAFNPYTQTPYFPGSSIKGAIRTALLNALNNNQPLPFRVDETRDVPRGEGDKLQKRLLGYNAIPDDPLRLLKIGDASYQHPDALHGLEIRFAVNRKNKAAKEKSMAETKGLYQLLECLPAHRSQSLAFEVNFLADARLDYGWTMQQLANACNAFFQPQLEKELKLMQQLNTAGSAWLSGLEKLLASELGEAFDKQQAFLLRIGQHSGAESNTLEGVRHIKIMQGRDKNPKYLPKPTTIWLAGDHKDQQRDLLPFGWVLIEIGGVVLDQTHAFLKAQAAPDYVKQEQLQHLADQRAEFLQQQRLKQEKLVQQQADDDEKERLKQAADAEKAQQMAAMTDAQQALYRLQQDYQTAKTRAAEPNGTLRQLLTQTINQAADWSSADKQALFEIGNELCTFWGKPKKLKDQLKSLQI